MAKTHGSVRMGPMSILVLVVVLCLAVMTVLSASTAKATYASAERQAAFTAETYRNEAAAQAFLAKMDERLQAERLSGRTAAADAATVKKALPQLLSACAQEDSGVTADAAVKGRAVTAVFSGEHGRTLNVVLELKGSGAYSIRQWKTSAAWSNDTDDMLWTGNAGEAEAQGGA